MKESTIGESSSVTPENALSISNKVSSTKIKYETSKGSFFFTSIPKPEPMKIHKSRICET